MPIPLTSEIAECTVYGKQAGQLVMNVFHYYSPTGLWAPTLAQAQTAANDWWDGYINIAAYLAMFNPDYTIERVSAQIIWPTRYARGFFQPAAPVAGTRAGTAIPPQTQWSATTRADLAGVSGHGGNRYAGLNIADTLNGSLKGAFQAIAAAGVLGVYSDVILVGVACPPLIYNRNTPEDSNEAISYVIEDEVRTMRRRVVGRGK